MKTGKLFTKLLAVALTGSLLFTNQPWTQVVADEVENERLSTQYVSEVKLFYAENYWNAQELAEPEGFTVCPENLKQGSKSVCGAFLGYKTTTDPDCAITDLTLLDMKNSHFEEMSYKEYLDKYLNEFADEAAKCMVLVNEFRKAYKKGTDSALIAYDSLNMFYVDEKKSHTAASNLLGNYILNECDVTFFEKFIQRGSAAIYQKIIGILAGAASDYGQSENTWIDRAKKSAIPYLLQNGDSTAQNELDSWYQDSALQIIRQIRSFAETYKEAKSLYDTYGENFGYNELDALTEDSTQEDLAEASPNCKLPDYVDSFVTYGLLNDIEYQAAGEVVISDAAVIAESEEDSDAEADSAEEYTVQYTERKTLAEFFLELAEDPDLELHPGVIYPLVDSMTTAQRTVLEKCGLRRVVELLFAPDDYRSNRDSLIRQKEEELKAEGLKDGKIYLWSGVDESLLTKKTVITSEAIERANAGQALIDFENADARAENSTLRHVLEIVDISTMAISGIAMIAQAIVGTSLWSMGAAMVSVGAWAAAEGCLLGVGTVLLGSLLCSLFVLNVLALVVSLGYMVYTILDMCGVFKSKTTVKYSTIPDIMFHVRSNASGMYRVRYDIVAGNTTAFEAYWGNKARKMAEDRAREAKEKGQNVDFDDATWDRIHAFASMFSSSKQKPDIADLGAYQGLYDRWMVLYSTKSQAAGQPIPVVPGESIVKTQLNDYHAPEGYRGVALASAKIAEDINQVEIDGKSGTPLYMFFPGKSSAIGSATIVDSGVYVSKVWLVHDSNSTNAIKQLKKEGYQPINVNLTPDDDYTFIGYKTGSAAEAMTDLRASTLGLDVINYGDAHYARAGTALNGTIPDGMALYETGSACAGTPIAKISVETKRRPIGDGSEPVCLFSGGNAVDWKREFSDNVKNEEEEKLKTKQDNPDDGIYIYFWPKEQYKAPEGESEPPYVSGFSYFAAVDSGKKGDYGTNAEYMQKFAKANGFELIEQYGEPMKMMSDESDLVSSDAHAVLYDDDAYRDYHFYHEEEGTVWFDRGKGFTSKKDYDKECFKGVHMALYFGVSYTYNPYRAITGVSGLLTEYSELMPSLKSSGLPTPAGTMQLTNVSVQGMSVTSAGITFGYYNIMNLNRGVYTYWNNYEKTGIPWMTQAQTEIHNHNLLTAGAAVGRLPLRRDDFMFVTHASPGQYPEYVPVCDMRTPGDYSHPMNFALDTVNHASKYLYIYLRKDAGGIYDTKTGSITDSDNTCHNAYTQKKYVAAVVCGTGRNSEEALINLYAKAAEVWPSVAAAATDLPAHPLVTELDEIIPVDLSAEHPWYTLQCNDSKKDKDRKKLKFFERGLPDNEAFFIRWSDNYREHENPEKCEKSEPSAYIGVIRTNNAKAAAYGILKYYTDDASVPPTINVSGTSCTLAGGPVVSEEGQYYLYYSANTGSTEFSAPITEITVDNEMFRNGMNTALNVSASDRVNGELPSFGDLRMRRDEHCYIHTGFEMQDLPYIESIYVGTGKSKEEAYADMIGTTNANAATSVNVNYNAYTDQWIAIGYRRTAKASSAIRDVFLYIGDDPPSQFRYEDVCTAKKASNGKVTFTQFTTTGFLKDKNGNYVKDANGNNIRETLKGASYELLKHNTPDGAEPFSLNTGTGGANIYLYYSKIPTTKALVYGHDVANVSVPIRNLAFAYGSLSPEYADAEQLAEVYQDTLHGQAVFDANAYSKMSWENVLAYKADSPDQYTPDGTGCFVANLNYGTLPKYGNKTQHTGDKRVRMYVDRGADYTPRAAYALNGEGYYSTTTEYVTLKLK